MMLYRFQSVWGLTLTILLITLPMFDSYRGRERHMGSPEAGATQMYPSKPGKKAGSGRKATSYPRYLYEPPSYHAAPNFNAPQTPVIFDANFQRASNLSGAVENGAECSGINDDYSHFETSPSEKGRCIDSLQYNKLPRHKGERSKREKGAREHKKVQEKVKGFCRKPWQFLCHNGRCISQDHYCDGKDSCGDNSDEFNCTRCNKTIHVTKMWQLLKSPVDGQFKKGQSVYCHYLLQIPSVIHKPKNQTKSRGPPVIIQTNRQRHKVRHHNHTSLSRDSTKRLTSKMKRNLVNGSGDSSKYAIVLTFLTFNFGLFDESENCFDGYLRIVDGSGFSRNTLRSRLPPDLPLTRSPGRYLNISLRSNETDLPYLSTAAPVTEVNCDCDSDPELTHEMTGVGSYLCGQVGRNKGGTLTGPITSYTFYSQSNWVRLHLSIRQFDSSTTYFALKFRAIDMTTKFGYRVPKGPTTSTTDTKTDFNFPSSTPTISTSKDSAGASSALIPMASSIDRNVYKLSGTYCNRTYVDCDWPNCKIQSPGYPGFFLPSITCGYRLIYTKPGNFQVKLIQYGDAFNVGSRMCDDPLLCNTISGIRTSRKACPLGWVSFYDDDHPSGDKLIGTFCGDGKVPTIKSSGKALYIELKSLVDSSALVMRRFYFISTWVETRSEIPSFGSNFKPGTTDCDFVITSYQQNKTASTLPDADTTTATSAKKGDPKPKHKRNQYSDDQIWDDDYETKLNQNDALTKGKIVSLRHWFPSNTTCRMMLRGRPWERVWLYFKRYTYLPNEDTTQSIKSNETEHAPDPCSDMVSLIDSDVDNESTKLMARFCGHWGPKICRPAVERREKPRGRRFKRFLSCPSDSAIYISSQSSFLVVFHGSRGSYSQPDIRYDIRYEFVDTWMHGMSVRGTLCDEEFSSDKRKKGLITSPRNLAFLYYKGRMTVTPDRSNANKLNNKTLSISAAVKRESKSPVPKDTRTFAINCKYTLHASKYANEKLMINLYALWIHTSSHDNRRCAGCCSVHDGTCHLHSPSVHDTDSDATKEARLKNINYLSIKEELTTQNRKDVDRAKIMSATDVAPCFCNSRYSPIFSRNKEHHRVPQNYTYITRSSSTVVIEFNVAHLRWRRGNIYPERQAFELTYEYIAFDCGDKSIINNYEGRILFPPIPVLDKFSQKASTSLAGPAKGAHCRWQITVAESFWIFFTLQNVTLGKVCSGSYLRFWVPHFNVTKRTFDFAETGHDVTLKKLCQNETDHESSQGNNLFYLFSLGFNTHTYHKHRSNIVIVDLLSNQPDTLIHLTFSQLSLIKAIVSPEEGVKETRKWLRQQACTYQCPDNATCITEQQTCTGIPSCPSPSWMKRAQMAGGASGFYNEPEPSAYEDPQFCALKKKLKNSWQIILPVTSATLVIIVIAIIIVILVVKRQKAKTRKS